MSAGTASTKRASLSVVVRRMAQQAHELRAELSADDPNADSLAQSMVCAAAIVADGSPAAAAALAWLRPQLCDWEQLALNQAQVLSTEYSVLVGREQRTPAHHWRHGGPAAEDYRLAAVPSAMSQPTATAHLYETFLQHYSRDCRKRRGVFFTPQPIADYIVAQIDRLLREECDFPDGLASHSALGTSHSAFLIDPACGTGVFPLAVIDFLYHRLTGQWRLEKLDLTEIYDRWTDHIAALLPRLLGMEILPVAAFLAKLNIALKLAETNCDFTKLNSPLNILTDDTLSSDSQSKIQNPKSKIFPVLLGNPPFSSLSTTTNPWIARLVRGDDEIRGYIRANGQQLGERKTWLHDDYVKFIRLAQWHVEQAGCGIVGFVTNHGYLDNATFRLMRQELLRVFSRIEILDLHGNRKKHEVTPDGSRDENTFGLDQGTAIGIFCRPSTPTRRASEGSNSSNIKYSEIWGSRNGKLEALSTATKALTQSRSPSLALRASVLSPKFPNWEFIPVAATTSCPEYTTAWSLADAMPVNTTAPVTARDHFVVAFTRNELTARIEEFRDLSIPDEEIRRRYFNRTRSARYETGDTRGWKLNTARQIIAADSRWQQKIIRCLYRPFDWRYVFWHSAMIDWPRTEVTRHLMETSKNSEFRIQNSENQTTTDPHSAFCIQNSALCLIARRQQLPTQPCTFFWIADCLALDGVIRSDNRGSESLFPLYVTTTECQANFAPAFIDQFATATQLTWLPLGRGDLATTFGPEDLLAYIYALFHSPSYRESHAAVLRSDFPRIIPPCEATFFGRMCRMGHELIALHLLKPSQPLVCNSATDSVLGTKYAVQSTASTAWSVTPHWPDSVFSFRAGGYIALKKWLQPKHRSIDDADYPRIVTAIARTIEIMAHMDT